MKGNRFILLILLTLYSGSLIGQTSDTLPLNKRAFEYEYDLRLRNTIFPVALISYGIIGFDNPHLKSWNLGIRSEVLEHINTKYRADDYFQYAPGLAVYILDDAGLKAKHSFWDRTAVLAGSFLIQTVAVQTLKYTTNVMRPDSSAANSFPSGHTTLAFSGAEFLWQEYKDHSVWIGVSGYVVASTIGFARVINNKHWVTDVVAGAGIGILSTKVSYFVFERLRFKKRKNNRVVALVSPYYNSTSKGVRFKMLF